MFALIIIYCLVAQVACLQVKVPLSDIECQYAKTDINTGDVIEKFSNINQAECIAKCFFHGECSHVGFNDASKECRLFKESQAEDEPEFGQMFQNIHCEAATKDSKLDKREASSPEVSRWDLEGVCCAHVRKDRETMYKPKHLLINVNGFSKELCFTNCQQLNCSVLIYKRQTKACKLYADHSDMCRRSTAVTVMGTDTYCDVKCHQGKHLPPSICSGSVTPTKNPADSCPSLCIDPCNITIHTNKHNYTGGSVCVDAKECKSVYIDEVNCYAFECVCRSPSDTPPYCTPGKTSRHPGPTTTTASPPLKGILIIGGSGLSHQEVYQDTVEFFSPEQGKGRVLSIKLKIARYGHISVTLDDGRVLVASGMGLIDGKPQPLKETELITVNPMSQPKFGASMSKARVFAGAANAYGLVYVCGGRGLDVDVAFKDCEVYYHVQDMWQTLLNDMKNGRWYFGLVAYCPYPELLSVELYAIGGQGHFIFENVEVYEIEKHQWVSAPSPGRNHHQSGYGVANGTIFKSGYKKRAVFLIGGHNPAHPRRNTYVYTTQDGFQRLDARGLTTQRKGCSLVNYEDQLYAISGSEPSAIQSMEVYNAEEKEWNLLGPVLKHGRANATAVLIGM